MKRFIVATVTMVMFFSINLVVLATDDLTGGLVGYWRMNEAADAVVTDSSDSGIGGSFVGTPEWTNGQNGSALKFPGGTSNYIALTAKQLPTMLNGAPAITASCWFLNSDMPAVGSTYRIISTYVNSNSIGFEVIISGGYLRINGRNVTNGAWTGANYTLSVTGKWRHLVATLDYAENNILLYLDGVLQIPASLTGSAQTNFGGLPYTVGSTATIADCIGGSISTNNTFNGLLDEMRIYRRKLTMTEVEMLARPEMKVGSILFYDTSGNQLSTLKQGEVKCRIPLQNNADGNRSVLIIYSLHKKSVNTMKDVVYSTYTAMAQSSETIEASISVPAFPSEYYLSVMVWNGLDTMKSYGTTILN